MANKVYLSLSTHESVSDKTHIDSMIMQAAGDIRVFRALYQDRFNTSAPIYMESDIPHIARKQFLEITLSVLKEPGQSKTNDVS